MVPAQELFVAVNEDEADALLAAIRDGMGHYAVSRLSPSAVPRALQERNLPGRDDRLYSAVGDIAVIAVSGAGLARALAPIVIEHIRASRRGVRVVRRDGSMVDIHGGFSSKEVEEILEHAAAEHVLPSDEA